MTQVKICGVTTVSDALAAVEAGADFVGLNFHPPSARHVELETARRIREAVGHAAKVVGIFVDRAAADVESTARVLSLDLVQLHGRESPEAYTGVSLPLLRAVRVDGPESLGELERWAFAEAFLLDGKGGPGTFGGVTFDWTLVKSANRADKPLWLAGGLTADNVGDAIRTARPDVVDVASGVEASPGRKDAALMRAFVNAVREVTP